MIPHLSFGVGEYFSESIACRFENGKVMNIKGYSNLSTISGLHVAWISTFVSSSFLGPISDTAAYS